MKKQFILNALICACAAFAHCAEEAPYILWKSESDALRCIVMNGTHAKEHVQALTNCLTTIREKYPYYLEPNHEEERTSMSNECTRDRCFLVFFWQETIVGFITAQPLQQTIDAVKNPLISQGLEPKDYLYVNELVMKRPFIDQTVPCVITNFFEDLVKAFGIPHILYATIQSARHNTQNTLESHGYHRLDVPLSFSWIQNNSEGQAVAHPFDLWCKEVPLDQSSTE